MIPEFGHFALVLAFCLALLQATVPAVGIWRGQPLWQLWAKPSAVGQCLLVAISFICLIAALLSNDFSVAYVAQNSNSHLPWAYRIAALWGAHEGSLLLWVMILNGWTLAVCFFERTLPLKNLACLLVVLAWISIGFLAFLLFTSNPFQRWLVNIPIEGADLNPILQDPGLAIHPPLLYMGYVGFAVTFAFAIAALLVDRLDKQWARRSRKWALTAWCFLTAGIILGSWWAYRELGWGGWWFWDPVENAAFLPWLAGTALIHSLLAAEKRGVFKNWTVLLAIVVFSLSLLGTFLVRSGVLISVHAFANDPARGAFLLKFLALVIGIALFIYAWRVPKNPMPRYFAFLSRETLLLANNILLVVIMSTVLLGTLYPLVLQAIAADKISVGPPYFNSVFIPLVSPLLLLMGVGPLCAWQKTNKLALSKQIAWLLLAAFACAFVLMKLIVAKVPGLVLMGVFLACWIIFATVRVFVRQLSQQGMSYCRLPRQIGMIVAHLGVAICLIGVTLASHYQLDRNVIMQPGDRVQLGVYTFKFAQLSNLQGPNYQGASAVFQVFKGTHPLGDIVTQKRIYTTQRIALSEAGIDAGMFRDLYVVLGDEFADKGWIVRIYYKPFVRWIWAGGLLMITGGVLALVNLKRKQFILTQ